MTTPCSKCHHLVSTGDRFCDACGAETRRPADDPAAVERYTQVFRELASSGALEDWAEVELAALRSDLGVSPKVHASLLESLAPNARAAANVDVVLEVDEAPLRHFVAGAQGVLRVRLRNAGARVLRAATVRWGLTGNAGIGEKAFSLLRPGAEELLAIETTLAKAGHLDVSLLLRVEDLAGLVAHYRADPLLIHVGASGRPSTVVFNIDQSGAYKPDAAVVAPAQSAGGALGEARWVALRLAALSAEAFAAADLRVAPSAEQAPGTFVVAVDGGGHFKALDEAVRQAPAGSTLLLRPGIYKAAVELTKSLTLRAEQRAVLEGAGAPCLVMKGGVSSLEGIAFRGSHGEAASVVIEGGDVAFTACEFTSTTGSGLTVKGAVATLTRCTAADSARFGVAAGRGAKVSVLECDLRGNRAAGLAAINASATIRETKSHGNGKVGLVFHKGGGGLVERCQVIDNGGAGIDLRGEGALTVRDTTVRGCGGPGVHLQERATGLFERCELVGNDVANMAVASGSTPTVIDSRLHVGRQRGLYVETDGAGTFQRCEISESTGPGVSVATGGAPSLQECTIRDGQAAGVLALDRGSPRLQGCGLLRNAGHQVLLESGGGVLMEDCIIREGKQTGLRVEADADATLTECAIAGHVGHGAQVEGAKKVSLDRCTLEDNAAGGVVVRGSEVHLGACAFRRNGAYGTWAFDGAEVEVAECTYETHLTGVGFSERATGAVRGCTISGAERGLVADDASPAVSRTTILDCAAGIVLDGPPASQGTTFEDCKVEDFRQVGATYSPDPSLRLPMPAPGQGPLFRECEFGAGQGPALEASGRAAVRLERGTFSQQTGPAIAASGAALVTVNGTWLGSKGSPVVLVEDARVDLLEASLNARECGVLARDGTVSIAGSQLLADGTALEVQGGQSELSQTELVARVGASLRGPFREPPRFSRVVVKANATALVLEGGPSALAASLEGRSLFEGCTFTRGLFPEDAWQAVRLSRCAPEFTNCDFDGPAPDVGALEASNTEAWMSEVAAGGVDEPGAEEKERAEERGVPATDGAAASPATPGDRAEGGTTPALRQGTASPRGDRRAARLWLGAALIVVGAWLGYRWHHGRFERDPQLLAALSFTDRASSLEWLSERVPGPSGLQLLGAEDWRSVTCNQGATIEDGGRTYVLVTCAGLGLDGQQAKGRRTLVLDPSGWRLTLAAAQVREAEAMVDSAIGVGRVASRRLFDGAPEGKVLVQATAVAEAALDLDPLDPLVARLLVRISSARPLGAATYGRLTKLLASGGGWLEDAEPLLARLLAGPKAGGEVELVAARKVVATDPAEAARLAQISCDDAHVGGCSLLAELLLEGRGITRNPTRAEELSKRGCESGHGPGCYVTGLITFGDGNDWKRWRDSIPIFEKACNLGDGRGCTTAGKVIEKDAVDSGSGFSEALARALVLHEKGCVLGDGRGCFWAGVRHRQGIMSSFTQIKRDDPKAAAFLERGCTLQYGLACERLAIAYEEGEGLGKDPAQAAEVRAKACSLGVEKACVPAAPAP